MVSNSYCIYDTARRTFNPYYKILRPDVDDETEQTDTNDYLHFTSNGFFVKGTNNRINANGNWFWGIAFAEKPFKYANGAI